MGKEQELTTLQINRHLQAESKYQEYWMNSKSPRIRTYFFESQAEIGSYFKDTKINFKVSRFLFEGYLMLSP